MVPADWGWELYNVRLSPGQQAIDDNVPCLVYSRGFKAGLLSLSVGAQWGGCFWGSPFKRRAEAEGFTSHAQRANQGRVARRSSSELAPSHLKEPFIHRGRASEPIGGLTSSVLCSQERSKDAKHVGIIPVDFSRTKSSHWQSATIPSDTTEGPNAIHNG
jgi:hypothetical protein